ncbi:MCT family MFS transporter [Aspergillus chevalieri]|uniref:Major facilitator superfamily (MFS) profile domain-containing protein n=1 Tax=Aspergillus chevalieri TaxID=182096 RepID=A0A7R7VS36_ASPCH|nr:uncharacterized protein ACHE_50986A [Aspergillus chevalieri]BCR89788.1 hypothetical protein ACHE_50986A [Aspergillus chevalieri]
MHTKNEETHLHVQPRDDDKANFPPEDPSSFDQYPDRGWRAWLVVLGAWCALVPAFGIVNTIAVLEEWLSEHQLKDYPKSSVSWIFSLWVFFFYLGGVQVGPIFDAHGLKPLLIPGCTGIVVSLMILSVSTEFYQFILGFSLLGGVTASMVFTPSLAAVNHWFLRRRALANGFANTAGSIGGIIFPLMVGDLSEKVGFPWAIRVMGFVCAIFCVASTLLLRTRLPPNKEGGSSIDLRALCDVRLSTVAVAIILIEIGFLIPMTYLVSYATSHDVDGSLSYQLMAILNAASIFGRVIPGYLADQWGRFNVIIVTTFVCTVLILALWLKSGTNAPAIVSFAASFGFWSGTAISLAPVCVAQISKTEEYGKRYGTTYSLVSFGSLVAIPVAGEILKAQNGNVKPETNYSGLIVFAGVAYGGSMLFFIISRGVSGGWGLKKIF